jgi:uncharacterized protein (DUF58 family)
MSPEPVEALLQRLRWTLLRPLATRLGGDERSLLQGDGMEIVELREYQPGDDVRRIDWNVTARSDRPYVRESHVERSLDVWLLIDVSASVDWGTAECLKRDRAVELTGVAGQLLGRQGNRVGAMLFADKPLGFVPPSAGRAHLLRLLAAVREEPRQAARGQTDLAAALRRAETLLRHRSLVVVVTDFLAPDGWQPALRRLAARHEVVATVLHDPRESDLADVGLVTFEDPETGQQLVVDTGSRRLRERFRAAAAARAESLRTELARAGADVLAVGTDEALLPTLIRFLDDRHRQRARRAPNVRRVPAALQPTQAGAEAVG